MYHYIVQENDPQNIIIWWIYVIYTIEKIFPCSSAIPKSSVSVLHTWNREARLYPVWLITKKRMELELNNYILGSRENSCKSTTMHVRSHKCALLWNILCKAVTVHDLNYSSLPSPVLQTHNWGITTQFCINYSTQTTSHRNSDCIVHAGELESL